MVPACPLIGQEERCGKPPEGVPAVLKKCSLVAVHGTKATDVHGGATGFDDSFEMAAKGAGLAVEAYPVTDRGERESARGRGR
jgi:hypothetical protein